MSTPHQPPCSLICFSPAPWSKAGLLRPASKCIPSPTSFPPLPTPHSRGPSELTPKTPPRPPARPELAPRSLPPLLGFALTLAPVAPQSCHACFCLGAFARALCAAETARLAFSRALPWPPALKPRPTLGNISCSRHPPHVFCTDGADVPCPSLICSPMSRGRRVVAFAHLHSLSI